MGAAGSLGVEASRRTPRQLRPSVSKVAASVEARAERNEDLHLEPAAERQALRSAHPQQNELCAEDEAAYEGELANLNDGAMGYAQLTARLAASGDPEAVLAVANAEAAASIYRRDASLAIPSELLELLAPRVRASTLGGAEGERCLVCQEDWHSDQELRLLPCGHAFHLECADAWLTQNVGS